jgi:hypothetical protein
VSRQERSSPGSQGPAGGGRRRGRRPGQGAGSSSDEAASVEQAADAFGKAMFVDAEFGLLLRLVRAEIDDQEKTNCERYISDDAAARFARQMSRLRTVERKLQRQRGALRGSRGDHG